MKVELRSDHVHISGYVNAVERYSRPMRAKDGRFFVEKIEQGVFKRALEKAGMVEVKHNHKRVLTSTTAGNVQLQEDNIGLYCEADIYDAEIIQRAKDKELVGWSFGFVPLKFSDKSSDMHGIAFERTIKDMKLNEVSLIDTRAVPCYSATSIEVRSDDVDDDEMLMRAESDCVEYESEEPNKDPEKGPEEDKKDPEDDNGQERTLPDFSLLRAKIKSLEY